MKRLKELSKAPNTKMNLIKKTSTALILGILMTGGWALLAELFSNATTNSKAVSVHSSVETIGFNQTVYDWNQISELELELLLFVVNQNGQEYANITYTSNNTSTDNDCSLDFEEDVASVKLLNSTDDELSFDNVYLPEGESNFTVQVTLKEKHCPMTVKGELAIT